MNVCLSKEAEARVHQIARDHRGSLTPDMILAEAKKKGSPLNRYFQWDVAKAARERWLDTARSIISSIRIERRVENRTVNAVAYVRDPRKIASGEQGYISLERAARSEKATLAVLHYELDRMRGIMDRVHRIASALGMAEDAARLEAALAIMEAAAADQEVAA